MKITTKKMVISGPVLELYEFEKPIIYDYRRSAKVEQPKTDAPKVAADEQSADSALRRAKRNIRRLITANVGAYSYGRGKISRSLMLTLTFSENITELDAAHYEFMLFVQRVNDYCFGVERAQLKYLTVTEYQKRGAIHYHTILFNLPHMKNVQAELKELWRNGIIFISPIRSILGAASYVTKYLTKETGDVRLRGRKKFFASRGLIQPLVICEEDTVKTITESLSKQSMVYAGEFDHPKCGMIHYRRYILLGRQDIEAHLRTEIEKVKKSLSHLIQYAQHDIVPKPTGSPIEGETKNCSLTTEYDDRNA